MLDDCPCHLDNFICTLIFISLSVAFFIVADLEYTPVIIILWGCILIYGVCVITDVPAGLGYISSLALNGIEYITRMIHSKIDYELKIAIGYVIVSSAMLTIPLIRIVRAKIISKKSMVKS